MRKGRALLALTAALSAAVAAFACGEREPTALPPLNGDLLPLPPLTGNIKVVTSTTGFDLDPNGYTVTLNLLDSKQVATNGSVTFTGVLTGAHVVELSGAAGNCTVTSSNPQADTVVAGTTTQVNFTIHCKATTGSLAVITQTSGQNLDPDGYTVTVQTGTQSKAIGINDTVTFTGLSPGDHTVTLSGVAANCTVTAPNPRTVTVTAGQTASTTFEVTCEAAAPPGTGTLSVTTSTTGEGIPAGYTLFIQGPSVPQGTTVPIGANANLTETVEAGDYTLELTDVPTNCTVSPNPRVVTVPGGGTGSTTFAVTCEAAPTTGTLEVITSTTGSGIPQAGYTLSVSGPGGSTTQGIAANATVTFPGIASGDYTVGLSDVPTNCTVTTPPPNPRTVNVPAGGTGSTTFVVTCEAATTTGTLEVITSTTGEDTPASYTLSITGPSAPTGATVTVAANGTLTETVEAGDYTLEITDVPANCAVSPNPRVVTVPAGGTGSTTFAVTCEAAATGIINVTTSTTGEDSPGGYTLFIQGPSFPEGTTFQIGANETDANAFVDAGDYTLELLDVPANCTVSGDNRRVVTVPAGGTGSTTFSVTCTATTTTTAAVVVTGGSAIGPGAPIPGSDLVEFFFDVTNAPNGTLLVRDYTFVRSDGTVASLTVDPVLDPSTGIGSFTQTSPTCATFDGIGRLDTGQLVGFSVDACDNGTPGVGVDTFGLSVAALTYSKSGTLTEGEVTLGTL